jgi:hypothetical protein
MANQTFVDFDLRTQLLSGDYLVGYKEDGSTELKVPISQLLTRSNLLRTSFGTGSATGNYSHAEGNSTEASGFYSHAEGSVTLASGDASHAEGAATTASGQNSHAEGFQTVASTNQSHAEGFQTVASGSASHTEGQVTRASGSSSHAEGQNTIAFGDTSHAAGFRSTAAQNYTYAWSDGNLGTLTRNISTTRTGQYMVSASGGVFIPGNVGIGTDDNSNALTVNGIISTPNGNSIQWNSTSTTVRTNSALWATGTLNLTDISSNSGRWNNTLTTVNTNSASWNHGNRYLTLSGGTVSGDITSLGTLYSNVLSTATIQTIYEGAKANLTINNNLTATQVRIGRLSMLDINYGTNSVLRLSGTSISSFKPGDVVGIAARQIFPTPTTATLRIVFERPGQPAIFVTDLLGGYGYNEGATALVYNGTSFDVQYFDNQNIKSITSELRVESIQANDPGTPFNTIGRGTFVHGLTLNGGDIKFTNGSDHFHLIHNGAGGNWQTLNGGYNHTPQRITQHTLAFRGGELQIDIVAANSSALTGNYVTPPYGVFPVNNNNYLTFWTANDHPALAVDAIVYFSVSPAGLQSESLRSIGFTAASYPAKIISVNNIGSANSNADIPAGRTLPGNAIKHFRLQPLNLTIDNWNGPALININGDFRSSQVPGFANNLINAGEIMRMPDTALLVPDLQRATLSALGGYNNVSMRNGCELVFDLTNTPLLSSRIPFLYEGLPVMVLLSTISTLTATNYGGLTPNSAKCQYGLPVDTTSPFPGTMGEFTGQVGGYQQQTYDGYIYRSTPTQVIIRLGQNRGTEESRMQRHASPNVDWFVDKPGSGVVSSSFSKSLPPGGSGSVDLNGFRLDGVPGSNRLGAWSNCNTGAVYSMPTILKSGLEFSSFPSTSSSNIQLFVYAGNKDPVHRPVAGMQLFAYERYPNIQPDLKETGAIVSKFALGPSCEGFDRDTAAIGFGSTAYHYRSIAIGHRVETLSAEEVVLGVDNTTLRIGNSAITVSPAMLSSNGVDTFLRVRNTNNNIIYGLRLQVIG